MHRSILVLKNKLSMSVRVNFYLMVQHYSLCISICAECYSIDFKFFKNKKEMFGYS